MKKLIYCAAALATALFAGSCQRELLDTAQSGSTVTFAVEIPEVATKAVVVEDGSNINNLVYAVYRTEASDLATAATSITPDMLVYSVNPKATGGATKFTKEGKTNVTLELINNQKYIVLFWAQVGQTWVAGNDFDLTKIAYPSKLEANQSKYAAFAGAAYVEVAGASRQSVTLTRPFAQINLATANPTNYVVDIVSSSVKVDNVYPTFNVATKKAYGELRTVEYTKYENPDGSFGDYAHYVAMNYIFANPQEDGTTPVKVTCTMDTANHGTGIVKEISNVPVAQNYKTNIVGNLLTSEVDYEVTLDSDWGPAGDVDDDYIVNIVTASTAQDIQTAINEAVEGEVTSIKIEATGDNKTIDINDLAISMMSTKAGETDYGIMIPYGKSIILDLNGCTITQTKEQNAGYAMIKVYGDLTIIDSEGNGVITYSDNGNGGEYISNTISNLGTLTVKSGTIVNNSSAAVAEKGYPYAVDTGVWGDAVEVITNIEGGELRSVYSPLRNRADRSDKKVETNITGGKFYGRIDHQHSSNGGAIGVMNISGGEFNAYGVKDKTLMIFGCGKDASNIVLNITGGKFNAEIIKNTTVVPIGEGFNDKFITGGEYSFDPSEFVPAGYPVENTNGIYTIGEYTPVAKIGKVEYATLKAAVDAVQDGETITLIADETFTAYNYYDNGGWKDGLGYSGDQSFTIDLNGFTIKQNGALNDYLVWLKNDGTKANTITFKNGTMDAGTTAYCALCTANSHVNKLTVNLENITLINNKSTGSTVKIRAGSVLNVNAETKIIGKDSYLGIENWNAVVNIYDGAEIYMNGTTSYNGCLVGVGGNGTVNVYGGYGKGVRGGFIAMTSGGVINVEGGEWIANTDGTVGDNSNLYVLTAQNNKYENGYAGASIINVTGGTFRGGMDAWILNDVNVEKAELNISGGNFNANPTRYLAEGCEANEVDGIWTVRVSPVAKIGEVEYETLEDAVAAAKANETITVLRDVTLSEALTLPAGIIFNGNGKQINGTIYAGGDLTFAGHTKVTLFSASYYNRTITIGEGACLEVTSTGRVTLGYGNTFNITGSIDNAKTVDKANIHPSLIIPGGISITGGNDAAMNVTNAYVTLGNTSSKNSAANGEFTWNINNSIVDFTNQFTLSEPTNGMNPKFIVNVEKSVLTTVAKFCIAAPNSTINVNNSSITTSNNVRNSGTINLTNGSTLSGNTIQFGENGGNDGTINVDASKLYITATSTGHAFDGKESGEIILKNRAEATVTYYKDMTITNDGTCTFTGTKVQ